MPCAISYKVRIQSGEPEFDATPVAKIVGYPLEERDYRPFAQNIVCLGGDAVYIRMWAFEASPALTSELRSVFFIFKDEPQQALHVRLYIGEESVTQPYCEAFLEKAGQVPRILDGYTLKSHSGEDLQGIYWGGTLKIPYNILGGSERLLTGAGDIFKGNFYKLCNDGKYFHRGCFYPADFGNNPYALSCMGDFEAVNY